METCAFRPQVPPITFCAGITSWVHVLPSHHHHIVLVLIDFVFLRSLHVLFLVRLDLFLTSPGPSLLTLPRIESGFDSTKEKREYLPLYISVQSGTAVSCPCLSIGGRCCHASEVELCQQGWRIPKATFSDLELCAINNTSMVYLFFIQDQQSLYFLAYYWPFSVQKAAFLEP